MCRSGDVTMFPDCKVFIRRKIPLSAKFISSRLHCGCDQTFAIASRRELRVIVENR